MARAEAISAKQLSKPIDKAVSIALKRKDLKLSAAGVKATGSNLLLNWEIIGRRIRDLGNLNDGFKLATEITKGVKLAGIKGQPVSIKVGPDILVGFIEKAGLAKELFG